MSDANASTCRSNISLTCSLNESGTPAGAAGSLDVLDAQLHRRNRRLLAEALRVELIERDAALDVAALRLLRVRLGEERAARSEVIAADFPGGERIRRIHVGVADDGEDVA